MQDHELVTLLLSLAAFQENNGDCAMYADETAAAWLRERGLDKLFRRGLKPLQVPEDINASVFWAAGKLCALKAEELPSVMIDTDLIIWKDLAPDLKSRSIAVIHREDLREEIYPDPAGFKMKEGYARPADWDLTEKAANTALLYIKDSAFRDAYVGQALDFMENCLEDSDRLCPMVFAEQRILPMCAKQRGLELYSFVDSMERLAEQRSFTHIWGHKDVLRYNTEERRSFISRCMNRLSRDYPGVYAVAAGLKELEEYA